MISKPKVSKEESLALATKQLCLKEAFYGIYLMMLEKHWTDKIHSSGVGKHGINVRIYINELFWESLTDLWRLYVLKHDILNVVFHHLEIGEALPEKNVAVIASNIVCNQYIDKTWLPLFDVKYADYRALNEELYEMLKRDMAAKIKTREEVIEELRKIPPRGVYLHDFPELNLEPLKGMKYYYDKLLQAKNQQPGKGGSQCLNEILGDMEAQLPMTWDKDFSEFEGLSEADKKLLRAQLDYHMKEIAEQVKKSRGTIPSELSQYIDEIDKKEPPKFNWRAYLRRFTGGSERVDILRSRAKPNLRYPQNPGRRIRPKAHILVAVDTSGSMSDDDLRVVFHEIYHMHKMGTDVTVIQFDAAIHSKQLYKKNCEEKIKITGRGGTDFNPAIDYYNENMHKYNCMIMLTDGCCPAPQNQKGRVLWVLTPGNKNEDLKPQIILN